MAWRALLRLRQGDSSEDSWTIVSRKRDRENQRADVSVFARRRQEGRGWPRMVGPPADLSIIEVDLKQLGCPQRQVQREPGSRIARHRAQSAHRSSATGTRACCGGCRVDARHRRGSLRFPDTHATFREGFRADRDVRAPLALPRRTDEARSSPVMDRATGTRRCHQSSRTRPRDVGTVAEPGASR